MSWLGLSLAISIASLILKYFVETFFLQMCLLIFLTDALIIQNMNHCTLFRFFDYQDVIIKICMLIIIRLLNCLVFVLLSTLFNQYLVFAYGSCQKNGNENIHIFWKKYKSKLLCYCVCLRF